MALRIQNLLDKRSNMVIIKMIIFCMFPVRRKISQMAF